MKFCRKGTHGKTPFHQEGTSINVGCGGRGFASHTVPHLRRMVSRSTSLGQYNPHQSIRNLSAKVEDVE